MFIQVFLAQRLRDLLSTLHHSNSAVGYKGLFIWSNMIQAQQDSRDEGTTKPIPPQETEKIWHGSSVPQEVLPLPQPDHPEWENVLAWLLHDWLGVLGACSFVGDVDTKELEALNLLHCSPVDENGGVLGPPFPVVVTPWSK